MAVTSVMFRWLDALEKEFDKSYVAVDLLIGDLEIEDPDLCMIGKQKLGTLSSCFAQMVHKAQTITQHGAKLEAELVYLRTELAEAQAARQVAEKQLHNMLLQLHSTQLQLAQLSGISFDSEEIKKKLAAVTAAGIMLTHDTTLRLKDDELSRSKQNQFDNLKNDFTNEQLLRENQGLREQLLAVQGELYGTRLAARYLDKELAGRIQQIQLLGRMRDVGSEQHDKLWNQLEAEIQLHRHKTVIRALRCGKDPTLSTPPHVNGGKNRVITLEKTDEEGLGLYITGGREHGVPILISELQTGGPAERAGDLYVGDAILSCNGIDLRDSMHQDAVKILSSQEGNVTLELMFLSPEEASEDDISEVHTRLKRTDSEVGSNSSTNNLFPRPDGSDSLTPSISEEPLSNSESPKGQTNAEPPVENGCEVEGSGAESSEAAESADSKHESEAAKEDTGK